MAKYSVFIKNKNGDNYIIPINTEQPHNNSEINKQNIYNCAIGWIVNHFPETPDTLTPGAIFER